MDYIYSRVSTNKQDCQGQLLELVALYPDAKVVEEVCTSQKVRPLFTTLVASMSKGDRLIVYGLDRLGRKALEVLPVIDELHRRGIILIAKREDVDYSTPAGKMTTQIFVSMAEMERALISERTKAGLQAAIKRGKTLGRPSRICKKKLTKALSLVEGGKSIRQAAKDTGISESYIRKLMKAA